MLNLLKHNKNCFKKFKTNNLNLSPLKKGNDLKVNRHFPSSTKIWYNSIYSYNKNTLKNIPFSDKIVNNTIEMFFNLTLNNDLYKRNKYFSLRKIFVSKTEIKHTNNKAIITIYTYNKKKSFFTKNLSNLYREIFSYEAEDNLPRAGEKYVLPFLLKYKGDNTKKILRKVLKSNVIFNTFRKKFLKNKRFLIKAGNSKKIKYFIFSNYFMNLYKNTLIKNSSANMLRLKFESISTDGSFMFNNFLSSSKHIFKLLNNNNLIKFDKYSNLPLLFKLRDKNTLDKYNNEYYNMFLEESLMKELLYLKYNQILMNDAYKFNNVLLSRLAKIISAIYKKKVEFNIINLKSFSLDSYILSDIIRLRLEKKRPKIVKLLKKAVAFKNINKDMRYRYDIKQLYLNSYNNCINNYLNINKKDVLNSLFNNMFFNNTLQNKRLEKFSLNKLSTEAKHKYIYRSIKFRKIRGIRLEAKGRLNARLTASRSVFKYRYSGSLKNLDSSINNLSSALIRGSLRSNLDYANLNSTTRNGCFGIKGWVSSK